MNFNLWEDNLLKHCATKVRRGRDQPCRGPWRRSVLISGPREVVCLPRLEARLESPHAQRASERNLSSTHRNIVYWPVSRKVDVSANISDRSRPWYQSQQRHFSMLIIPSDPHMPYLRARAAPVYFFPLFLMPWEPVLRGPLLPFVFAANSALAFASTRRC